MHLNRLRTQLLQTTLHATTSPPLSLSPSSSSSTVPPPPLPTHPRQPIRTHTKAHAHLPLATAAEVGGEREGGGGERGSEEGGKHARALGLESESTGGGVGGGGGWGQEKARGSVGGGVVYCLAGGGVVAVTPESGCGLSASVVRKRERERDDVVRRIERGRDRAHTCERAHMREHMRERARERNAKKRGQMGSRSEWCALTLVCLFLL